MLCATGDENNYEIDLSWPIHSIQPVEDLKSDKANKKGAAIIGKGYKFLRKLAARNCSVYDFLEELADCRELHGHKKGIFGSPETGNAVSKLPPSASIREKENWHGPMDENFEPLDVPFRNRLKYFNKRKGLGWKRRVDKSLDHKPQLIDMKNGKNCWLCGPLRSEKEGKGTHLRSQVT